MRCDWSIKRSHACENRSSETYLSPCLSICLTYIYYLLYLLVIRIAGYSFLNGFISGLFSLSCPYNDLFYVICLFACTDRLQPTDILHQTTCYRYVSRLDHFLIKRCHHVSQVFILSWDLESSPCLGLQKVSSLQELCMWWILLRNIFRSHYYKGLDGILVCMYTITDSVCVK